MRSPRRRGQQSSPTVSAGGLRLIAFQPGPLYCASRCPTPKTILQIEADLTAGRAANRGMRTVIGRRCPGRSHRCDNETRKMRSLDVSVRLLTGPDRRRHGNRRRTRTSCVPPSSRLRRARKAQIGGGGGLAEAQAHGRRGEQRNGETAHVSPCWSWTNPLSGNNRSGGRCASVYIWRPARIIRRVVTLGQHRVASGRMG